MPPVNRTIVYHEREFSKKGDFRDIFGERTTYYLQKADFNFGQILSEGTVFPPIVISFQGGDSNFPGYHRVRMNQLFDMNMIESAFYDSQSYGKPTDGSIWIKEGIRSELRRVGVILSELSESKDLNAALSSPGLPGGEWRPKGVPSMERENSKRGQILKGAPGLPGGKPRTETITGDPSPPNSAAGSAHALVAESRSSDSLRMTVSSRAEARENQRLEVPRERVYGMTRIWPLGWRMINPWKSFAGTEFKSFWNASIIVSAYGGWIWIRTILNFVVGYF